MTRILPVCLLLLTAVLAATIAHEIAAGGTDADAAKARPPAMAVEASTGGPSAGQVQSWAQTVLSRPLFDPSRRPSHASATAAGPLRLAGVIVGPFGRRAIFVPAAGGKPIVVERGARVGRETVRDITADAVTLGSAGGDHVVRPTFAVATPPGAGFIDATTDGREPK